MKKENRKNPKITMIFADHHIHSSMSRCCHQTYTLIDIINQLKKFDMPYFCISDHIHYDNDDKYFSKTLKYANEYLESNLDLPLFIGAEITIIDQNGNIPNRSRSSKYLNYIIVGDHYIPGTSISMEDPEKGKDILHGYIQNDSDILMKVLDIVKSMYINTIAKNKPDILAHPFSTLLRCGFTHNYLLEIFESVCETCQEIGTAIELNRSQLYNCTIMNSPVLMEHPDIPPKDVFYDQMIKISKKYDIFYSLGSDAHGLVDVGNIVPCVELLRDYHIAPNRLLDFIKNEKDSFF